MRLTVLQQQAKERHLKRKELLLRIEKQKMDLSECPRPPMATPRLLLRHTPKSLKTRTIPPESPPMGSDQTRLGCVLVNSPW
jgi:hypothetical protein